MAPKRRIEPKPRTIKAAKKDGNVTKDKTKPATKDPLAGTPRQTCATCDQSTSTVDRQSKPGEPVWLQWVQTHYSPKHGMDIPNGHECYPCYFVRRKHFNNCKQSALLEQMSQSAKAADKVAELRADHVGGYGKFKKTGTVDLKTIIEKTDEDFEERYISGCFEPLHAFCKKRGIAIDEAISDEDLALQIQERYDGYDVGYDKNNILGVEIRDGDGSGYKFKRGVRDAVSLRKIEKQQDPDDAEEHFKKLSSKRSLDRVSAQIAPGPGAVHSLSPSTNTTTVGSTSPGRDCDIQSIASAASGHLSGCSSWELIKAAALGSIQQQQLLESPPTSSEAGPKPAFRRMMVDRSGATASRALSKSVLLNNDAQPIEAADEEDDETCSDAPPQSRLGRMDKNSRTKASAEKEMASVLAKFGDDTHWANHKKKKELEVKIRALRKWARGCGQIVNDEHAALLSSRIFDEAELIEERQSFFDDIRTDFVEVVNGKAGPLRCKVIANLKPEVLCEVVAQGCMSISPAALNEP